MSNWFYIVGSLCFSACLVKLLTAYADEKLEEAAKLVDHWNMERDECAKAIRALKSTPAPGGASK